MDAGRRAQQATVFQFLQRGQASSALALHRIRRLGEDLLEFLEGPPPKAARVLVPFCVHDAGPSPIFPQTGAISPLSKHSFFSNQKSESGKKASEV
jgi:hypothetical protein